MSRIPDCRTDENYNEKYLTDKDAEFVAGFDWCQIYAVENFFDNIDIYESELEIENEAGEECFNLVEYLEQHESLKDALKESILHYIEMQRDELITSMIDDMNDELYAARKVAVDKGEETNCLFTYAFEMEEKQRIAAAE